MRPGVNQISLTVSVRQWRNTDRSNDVVNPLLIIKQTGWITDDIITFTISKFWKLYDQWWQFPPPPSLLQFQNFENCMINDDNWPLPSPHPPTPFYEISTQLCMMSYLNGIFDAVERVPIRFYSCNFSNMFISVNLHTRSPYGPTSPHKPTNPPTVHLSRNFRAKIVDFVCVMERKFSKILTGINICILIKLSTKKKD